ncbi:MAG: hypothetical protein M9924_03135 [Rhizobiaceae bacterium]|nr:hypothetical protein [Rhizobiaceae bacterium]
MEGDQEPSPEEIAKRRRALAMAGIVRMDIFSVLSRDPEGDHIYARQQHLREIYPPSADDTDHMMQGEMGGLGNLYAQGMKGV